MRTRRCDTAGEAFSLLFIIVDVRLKRERFGIFGRRNIVRIIWSGDTNRIWRLGD